MRVFWHMLLWRKEDTESPETEVIDGCEPTHRWWELHSSPLEEQLVLQPLSPLSSPKTWPVSDCFNHFCHSVYEMKPSIRWMNVLWYPYSSLNVRVKLIYVDPSEKKRKKRWKENQVLTRLKQDLLANVFCLWMVPNTHSRNAKSFIDDFVSALNAIHAIWHTALMTSLKEPNLLFGLLYDI